MAISKKALAVSVAAIVVFVVIAAAAYYYTAAPQPTAPPPVKAYKGRAFTVGHGGHVMVADFAIFPENKSVKIYSIARIVAKGYGSEKASHTIELSPDGKTLYWAALDGTICEIDLEALGLTLDKTPIGKLKPLRSYLVDVEWRPLGGEKSGLHCGSSITPDGKILYVSSIADGSVLIYDTSAHERIGRLAWEGMGFGCLSQLSPDGKYIYVANMAAGYIDKIEAATGSPVKRIDLTGKGGYFLHIGQITPDGKYLWQTAGNEFKAGKVYALPGGESPKDHGIVVVDLTTDEPIDYFTLPGNPHDLEFTPDGKYCIVSLRHTPTFEDSSLCFIEVETKEILANESVCYRCHGEIGADLSKFIDPETKLLAELGLLEEPVAGVALHCGVDILWAE